MRRSGRKLAGRRHRGLHQFIVLDAAPDQAPGFRLRGRQTSLDVWVAEDIPAGPGVFADFLEWSGAAQALGGLVAAIRDLPGFPLETRTRVSVLGETQETIATVTTIRVGPQPAGLFEVPAGWRVESEKP